MKEFHPILQCQINLAGNGNRKYQIHIFQGSFLYFIFIYFSSTTRWCVCRKKTGFYFCKRTRLIEGRRPLLRKTDGIALKINPEDKIYAISL